MVVEWTNGCAINQRSAFEKRRCIDGRLTSMCLSNSGAVRDTCHKQLSPPQRVLNQSATTPPVILPQFKAHPRYQPSSFYASDASEADEREFSFFARQFGGQLVLSGIFSAIVVQLIPQTYPLLQTESPSASAPRSWA
ncbi:hypothetical protein B0H13DRAFT_2312944 [Mycena leptocephala]|nr:hypothetical protein B0H13DRAFT_2312944 [Mycena leptocephala]